MITLMFITNNTTAAKIAEKAGVDRIWVDLEKNGKEERQKGLNTVKSNHTYEDISVIKNVLTSSELMVRVNPLNENSRSEIDEVIKRGANYVMLPMYKTLDDVVEFITLVNGRAKTILLLETIDAAINLESYVSLKGIDEIHIGLNDLHLEHKKKFMFELLSDGTIDKLSKIMNENNKKFGFGGIARIGYGQLPAEYILTEHYRVKSQMVILSRSFGDLNLVSNPEKKEEEFIVGVKKIREYESKLMTYTDSEFQENRVITSKLIESIVNNL